MVSQIQSIPHDAELPPQLRRMDPARDMADIADVIEVAFFNELSPGGHLIMRDLRLLNTLGPLIWVVTRAIPSMRNLLGGYVWEEDGRVIANTTLTRADERGRHWVVSNVAVLPEYRRRGIARAMMEATIEYVRQQGGKRIMLQVHCDNKGAKTLYKGLGFDYVETVTEMRSHYIRRTAFSHPSNVVVCQPEAKRWQDAYEVASAAIPSTVQKIRPLRVENFRLEAPSLMQRLRHILFGTPLEHWWVEVDGNLMGLLTIQRQFNQQNERFELLIHPKAVNLVEEALLNKLTHSLRGHGTIHSGIASHLTHARALLRQAGFRELRTLDQMLLEL
jgi:ribosomal protein S18 acetylase RimI-like enzyme